MKKKFGAFLSHNSQDKPIVEQIALWLEDEAKLRVWLDKWNLVPGEPWQEEDALHRLVCGIKGISPGRDKKAIQTDICPFRGLEVFREQDSRFFFGREAVVQRLMDKLDTSRFLAVVGPSGCGKSSVVQAGIIPNLRENSLLALFTPKERPIEELSFALRNCFPKNIMPPVEQLINRLKESDKNLHYIAR
jgi:hypothetical protein